MITEEQKQRRKQGLFSSDVARIMTGNEVKVALEKIGAIEEEDFGDVMEISIGTMAERFVLDAYEQRIGAPIERNLDTLMHPLHPWLGCHRDAARPGVNVEAKTVGFYNRNQWGDGGDEIPDYVLWQVICQMACSGDTVTEIPVCFITATSLRYLFLQQPPPITVFRVEKDYQLEEYLIQKAGHVWQCINEGITPEPRKLEDIKFIYPRATTDVPIEADAQIEAAWRMLLQVKEEKKQIEQVEEDLKLGIQKYMRGASLLQKDGVTLATWKNDRDSERFDEKRFAAEHPELYKQYLVNKVGARKFLPKVPKGEKR